LTSSITAADRGILLKWSLSIAPPTKSRIAKRLAVLVQGTEFWRILDIASVPRYDPANRVDCFWLAVMFRSNARSPIAQKQADKRVA
jgi:hypothetical protein